MFSKLQKVLVLGGALAAVLAGLPGCMTPEKARREADETAVALATAIWREQTGLTNAFDVARPADVLSLRLALEAVRQGVTNAVFPRVAGVAFHMGTNGLLRLTLDESLRIGARNNRKYQTLKEGVYQKALALDDERYAFDNTFSGYVLGAFTGDPEINKSVGEGGLGMKRKLENGATLGGNMAVDVAKMIREDWHSFEWTGDLTASVPLLRGSAREVVREKLTQAERNLDYALLTFERYRQTYALSVAKAYYNVLQVAQTRRNSDDNAKRLDLNWQRAEMMFKAGRMDRVQVDQARTDLLSARQSIITTQKSYEDALDGFKITLGLSPEAPVMLDDAELEKLQDQMAARAANQPDALSEYPREDDALNIALAERRDLTVLRGGLWDAERAVNVAADALGAELTVEGTGKYAASRRQHKDDVDDDTATDLKLRWSAPWDRRRERNAYGKALVLLEQARRDFEESEDEVRNEVRSGYRGLVAARALYENKVESYKVAKMRVEAIDLFTQSGRSSMRDTLDAARDLLSAQNALCSAVVDWRMSDLSLRSSLGVLRVREDGTWTF